MSANLNEPTGNRSSEMSMGWLLPLLLTVLSAGLVMYFMSAGKTGTVGVFPLAEDSTANINAPIKLDTALANSFRSLPLADGTEINVKKGSTEDQFFNYIISKDLSDSISKRRWFDFDQINFKSNSADVTAESMDQLKNIAAILKAYPNVKIKIGGYTDKTGNENANLELSQKRAVAVAEVLKALLTNPGQVTGGEGYGSRFARFSSNAPEPDKQKDRRISINVRAK